MATKIVFVTATDTGVGKTLLTALLLCHLRRRGARALALKPFCSGGRGDAELLHELQDGDLTLAEINPFYFPEPVAPLVSARLHKRRIPLDQVIQHISSIAARVEQIPPPHIADLRKITKSKIQNFLLIEGSGGLLVPLGEGYTVRDLIARLDCHVLVVSRNQLGTINHTLLTLEGLTAPPPPSSLRASRWKVVLMDSPPSRDLSRRTNPSILAELLAPIPLVLFPLLRTNCPSPPTLKLMAHRCHKMLSRLV
jgi:dethiobiotin synthetase